jgi:glyoxylate utilization-related uncharacterized protein
MKHLIFGFMLASLAAVAAAQSAGDELVFVKGQFKAPISQEAIIANWKARGFSNWSVSAKPKGWSRSSSYAYNCLRTVLSGRVEYVIDGKRYVAEPGDEIAYPANAKQTVTNLHDGDSVVLVATK